MPATQPQQATPTQPVDTGHQYAGPTLGSVAAANPPQQSTDPYAEFGGSVATAPASAAPAPKAGSDPYAEFGGSVTSQTQPSQPTQSNTQSNDSVAKHGLLTRAWNWVTSPVADTMLLPKDIKTSDIIKAAAFEKMFGEAYIPGFNDFDTKAEQHLNESAGKHALKVFISGAAKDASDMAASFTSPVGIATTLAGVGPEAKAGTALAKVAPVAKFLTGTAFGVKGLHDIYQAGTENTPEAWQQRLQGAAQVAGGAAAASEPVAEAASAVSNKLEAPASTVKNIVKGGQPKLQTAIRNAAQTGSDVAAARTAASAEPTENVNVPDEYKNVIDEALKQEPAWTPEKAEPVVKALGKDFEVRGSVGEGKVTDNDLDIWQKKGDLTDAHDTLKNLGFKRVGPTPHGETWTNTETGQNVDLWDAAHEPIKGYGTEQPVTVSEPAENETAPVKTTAGIRTAIEDVSNSVKAKSQALYQQLDKESGGRWQRYEDQIKNLNDKLDEVNGIDDDAYDRLETKRNDIETSQAQMLEELKEKGIDPQIADDAVAHYKQAMALRDLDRAVKSSTVGEARIGGKEVVNPKTFTNRIQKLYDSGRLEQALGETGANDLLKEGYDAVKAKRIQTLAKWTAGILAARYAGGSVLHHIVSAATMAP